MRPSPRALLRALYTTLIPAPGRSALKAFLLLDEVDQPARLISTFDEPRVVVLAPHMDDEVLGCGGVMQRHVAEGSRVVVVYLTDGSKGRRDLRENRLVGSAGKAAASALVEQRKAESLAACASLGVTDLVYLDGPDGDLRADERIVARVAAQLRTWRPSVVYLPSLLDSHDDHWQANVIFKTALEREPPDASLRPMYRGYEVWSPSLANALADVTAVIELKKAAIEQFESQLEELDYTRALLALNAYRSIHFGDGQGYAEAFCELGHEAYLKLFAQLAARR